MSSTSGESMLRDEVKPHAFTGPDRYWRAAEEWLSLALTPEQREICEAVADNRYLLVEGANGFGKTFANVALAHAFHKRHYPSSVVVTSGTYGKLKRTFCADAEALTEALPGPLQGEWKWSPNPHIDMGDEPTWQFEVHSPADPEELEGVHNDYTLVIVDEADKKEVDETVIDSMESLVADEHDRMVVIANPPKDEHNVVYQLRDDQKYGHVHFSSFDSHNVQLEAGWRAGTDTDMIGGLATVTKLRDDWISYNNEAWPGLEQARDWSDPAHPEFRDDLGDRWYRRRAGVMSPEMASIHRPYAVSAVEAAFDRAPDRVTATPQGLALDVARKGGDMNVLAGVFGQDLRIVDAWSGVDHVANEERVRQAVESSWRCPFAVDYVGTGDGLADRIDLFYPNRVRYNNGATAAEPQRFKTRWAEANHHFGEFLADGGAIANTNIREEALAGARALSYDERFVAKYDTEVLALTPKDAIKERLGHSPDYLDAAVMAVAMTRTDHRRSTDSTW